VAAVLICSFKVCMQSSKCRAFASMPMIASFNFL